MDRKEISIDSPLLVNGVTLIPVVELSLNYRGGNRSIGFFGVKQPIAVVVVSPSTRRAFRISGEEVPLDQLMQEIPSLKQLLAGI
jgi:hypothetical protein